MVCFENLEDQEKATITEQALTDVQTSMKLQYIHDIEPAIEHRYLQILIHIQASVWHHHNSLDTFITKAIKHHQPNLQEKDIETIKHSARKKIPIQCINNLFKYAQHNFLYHKDSTPSAKQTTSSNLDTNDCITIAVSFWDTLTTKIYSNIDQQIIAENEMKTF